MSTTYRIVSIVLLVALLGAGGWYAYRHFTTRVPGLVSEEIVHEGDTWRADFTALIPAPTAEVFDAIRNIEHSRSEQLRSVRIVASAGNTKTVELEMAAPAGQTVKTTLAFDYFPAENRITYRTVASPTLDTRAEYQLSDAGGGSTLLKYHQQTRMLQNVPLPDGLMKQVIRGIFVAQLQGLRRSLNLQFADEPDEEVVVP
ncbi:MAG: SRPBCC family protein [Candidatus Binataceae bacterium]